MGDPPNLSKSEHPSVSTLSLKENSEVIYKASGYYSRDFERSIIWNDPIIDIKWPLQIINYDEPTLSEKDADAPSLDEADIFI